MAERGYRSAFGLLYKGLAGPATITIAITTPASKDTASIIMIMFRTRFRARIPRSIRQRAISGRLSFALPSARASRSCVRAATRASVEEVTQERFGKPIEVDSLDRIPPVRGMRCVDLEAHKRENDVRQRQECERRTGQFAEHTVLRNTIGSDSLGLLPYLLKACESLINRGSSHFPHLP